MKKSMVGFCLMTFAAFAQSPGVLPSVQNERSLECFIVVQSSGTVPPGTMLYSVEPKGGLARRLGRVTAFTNSPYYLKHGALKMTQVTNAFNVGTTRVARVGIKSETEYSFFDGRKWYAYDYPNRVYVCENDFVMLERTNIVSRQQIQESLKRAEAAQEFNEEQKREMDRRKDVLSRCLSLTNTLTLAEAQARGIDIRLREVLTIEVEQDPKYGPTSVIRRRWVLSSEPFGEKIPGLASW